MAATEPMAATVAPAAGPTGGDSGLRRVLGPWDATSVVIGAIIGVGIFFTPSHVAEVAGSGGRALLAWAMGGAVALLGALTFAELGGMYSRAGGQYEILRDAYGARAGFLFVFCNATAIQAGAMAIIAIVCVDYLATAVTGSSLPSGASMAIGSLLIAALTLVNVAGARCGAAVQNATVAAKLLTLLTIAALAVLHQGGPAQAAPAPSGSGVPLLAAVVPTLFAFGGWQHALWIGGEVRDPGRNVPRAVVGGVLVVLAAYLVVNWAYLDLLGHAGVVASRAPAADAVQQVWPELGARAVAAAVAFSAFGVLNAQLLSGPRLIFAMARDGRFFGLFGNVQARFGTPAAAVVLLGVLALALLLLAQEQVGPLMNGVVLIDAVFFVLTGAALFVLRRKRPSAERPVRVPLFPLVPALFVAGECGVLIGAFLDPEKRGAAWLAVAWIGAAALLYQARFRRPAPAAST